MDHTVIWKFELQVTDAQRVIMPEGAKLLSVGDQRGTLCLWALCDPSAGLEDRHIEIVGTGNPISQEVGIGRRFIGTVLMEPFVWHVFESVRNA